MFYCIDRCPLITCFNIDRCPLIADFTVLTGVLSSQVYCIDRCPLITGLLYRQVSPHHRFTVLEQISNVSPFIIYSYCGRLVTLHWGSIADAIQWLFCICSSCRDVLMSISIPIKPASYCMKRYKYYIISLITAQD